MLEVSLGIDVEPDCPPYLATQYRGVTEGLPRILDVLDRADVRVTAFCTGQVASRFPAAVNQILAAGHEIGSHGHSHRPFDTLTLAEARREIDDSTDVLRSFGAAVTSFRAPNLRLPDRVLPLLEEHGYLVDASLAKYKRAFYGARPHTSLTRVAASTTSAVLRLPKWLRDPWLLALRSPVVLFVHPWEFVDLTRVRLRADCRFNTGEPALRAVQEVITLFRARDACFVRMDSIGGRAGQAAAA